MSDETYHLTEKGYDMIWDWIRLTSQLCEMEHEGECDELAHQVAVMLCFVLPPTETAKAAGAFE